MMKQLRGFTLIELLVVITIMTTVLSLVAPLMVEQVDKTRAVSEYQHLEQYISDSGKVAFLKGQAVHFRFDGKQLQRKMGDKVATLDFDYLFFAKQQLIINSNGFTSQKKLSVRRGGTELQLELADLL